MATRDSAHPGVTASPNADGFIGWLRHLKIRNKISLGYGVAIAITLGGSCLGNEVGDYYLWQAWQEQDHARQESELLYRLQTSLLYIQTEQRELAHLDQPADLTAQYTRLQTEQAQLEATWQALAAFVANHTEDRPIFEDNAIQSAELPDFLARYQGVSDAYFTELARVIAQVDNTSSTAQTSALLAALDQSQLIVALDEISQELRQLIRLADQDYQQALRDYDQADILRLQISVSSIVFSVLLAVWLAILTSQMIAKPLQAVTAVAQRVTRDVDFHQTVPILSRDETGQLATSLNQLMLRVQQLLAERESVNAQLNHKNQELQTTLATLQRTQIQMIQSEKMSGLGRMVAGVAHELNNPVNFIAGNLDHTEQYFLDLLQLLQLYQKYCPQKIQEIEKKRAEIDVTFLEKDVENLLASMRTGSQRIQNIVHSLRTFSRLDESALKTVDIHASLENTLLLLAHRLQPQVGRSDIHVIKRYGTLPPVECYAGQFNQVLMHLLVNAIDALEIPFEQNAPMKPQNLMLEISTQVWADGVHISIQDNGPGIPESVKSHIFDPFFTTKPVGRGSGLGLAISYQIIVDQHGGQLICASQPGKTTFTIVIPTSQSIHFS